MKTESQSKSKRYIYIVTWALLAILGAYTANRTYQYETVVRGILGVAFLYLVFFYLRYSGFDAPLDVMMSDHRRLVYAFIGPCLVYWATVCVLDMISLIIKTWLNV